MTFRCIYCQFDKQTHNLMRKYQFRFFMDCEQEYEYEFNGKKVLKNKQTAKNDIKSQYDVHNLKKEYKNK